MSGPMVDFDAAIDRILMFQPSATLSQIRTQAPRLALLTDDDLRTRVQRLRSRLIRKSIGRNRGNALPG